jgi:polar amino acid transport system substrate-binding protein/two-component system sensor histidine kinase EvgS
LPRKAHQGSPWYTFFTISLQASSPNLVQSEKLWIATHPIVRVGFHSANPPYSFANKNGEFLGILSSYYAYFENLLNIQFQPVPSNSWDELFEMIKEGEIDIVAAVPKHLKTPKYIQKTEGFLKIPLSLLSLKRRSVLENFDELAKKRIALTKDTFCCLL